MAIQKIFISYAWKDREQNDNESREDIVNDICKTFEQKGITIIRDRSHLTYKDSIKKFMQEIAIGNFIIIIISSKYLISEYCMFEAIETFKHGDFRNRVFPLVLNDANIFDFSEQVKLVKFWENKANEYNELANTIATPTHKIKLLERIKDCEEIARNIQDFLSIVADMNVLSPEIHIESDFEDIIRSIENKINQENKSIPQHTNSTQIVNNEFKNIFGQIEQQLIKNDSLGNVWFYGDYKKRKTILQSFYEININNEILNYRNQKVKIIYFDCSTVFNNKDLFNQYSVNNSSS